MNDGERLTLSQIEFRLSETDRRFVHRFEQMHRRGNRTFLLRMALTVIALALTAGAVARPALALSAIGVLLLLLVVELIDLARWWSRAHGSVGRKRRWPTPRRRNAGLTGKRAG